MNEVEAVKDLDMIKTIELVLTDQYGTLYGDIWKVGINTALRITDLLSVRYDQLEDESLIITEQKTGKTRSITLNKAVLEVVSRRKLDNSKHEYLFQSDSNRSRSLNKPVSRVAVSKAFKAVGDRNSIKIRLGTHSMRKTRGYHLLKSGKPLEQISKILGHSSPAITMRYIGLDADMVKQSYDDLVL